MKLLYILCVRKNNSVIKIKNPDQSRGLQQIKNLHRYKYFSLYSQRKTLLT